MIVVSILLAFGVDAWWDRRQDDAEGVELLRALEGDFATVRAYLGSAIESDSVALARTQALLDASRAELPLTNDSIRTLAFPVVVGSASTPTLQRYAAAVASGRIALIRSDSILVALRSFDAARERHEVLWQSMLDRFYSGSLDELRRDLGSLSVLNPRGGRGEPPRRFVPDDLNEVIQSRPVYATIEVILVSRINLLIGLRAMDQAAMRVLTALESELQ